MKRAVGARRREGRVGRGLWIVGLALAGLGALGIFGGERAETAPAGRPEAFEVPVASAGGGIAVRYGDVQLALFHAAASGAWYAAENRCPHTGDMVLGRGLVGDAGGRPKVACPQHKKTFDLESGAGLSDPEYCIATFPAKVEEGKVYVKLPSAVALSRCLGDAHGRPDCAEEK